MADMQMQYLAGTAYTDADGRSWNNMKTDNLVGIFISAMQVIELWDAVGKGMFDYLVSMRI